MAGAVAAAAAVVGSALLLGGCVHASTPVVVATGESTEAIDPATAPIVAPEIRGPLVPNATVVHVTDGDTIIVRLDGDAATGRAGEEHVRLIGIDTPETKKPDSPVECFGREASAAMAALLPVGTTVHLERDVEARDRYGRLLAYVFRASDGLFVNQEMVRTGMAASLSIAPNVTYADRFAQAAAAARVHAVGLWSRCDSGHEPLAAAATS